MYSFRFDFCSADNLKENKDSKFDNNFNMSNMTWTKHKCKHCHLTSFWVSWKSDCLMKNRTVLTKFSPSCSLLLCWRACGRLWGLGCWICCCCFCWFCLWVCSKSDLSNSGLFCNEDINAGFRFNASISCCVNWPVNNWKQIH